MKLLAAQVTAVSECLLQNSFAGDGVLSVVTCTCTHHVHTSRIDRVIAAACAAAAVNSIKLHIIERSSTTASCNHNGFAYHKKVTRYIKLGHEQVCTNLASKQVS